MKSLIFGYLFAFFGLVTAAIIVILLGNDYSLFLITAPLAAFLTGIVAWKILVNHSVSWIRIISAGLISSILSHYLCWLLTGIGFLICYYLTGGCTDSLGNPPSGITEQFTGSFSMTLFSLCFAGWITVPAGIISAFISRLIIRKRENVLQSGKIE